MVDDSRLAEQLDYYRARAGEYDRWWSREGRYDRGPEANARWFAEAAELERVLERFEPRGDVLELACGTGVWTERLAQRAATLTAVDAAPEMIDIAWRRAPHATFMAADLLTWRPTRRYDTVFFGFWLSHVPADRFAEFWSLIADCLVDGGRAVFVDEHVRSADKETWLAGEVVQRSLSDGSMHRVVKTYIDPPELTARLAELGWTADVNEVGSGWVLGEARRA
jgi:demethylmenaquinone methyltransferase/2-methoxy-6-polyprenyl-1,4-benzoquinol methylase